MSETPHDAPNRYKINDLILDTGTRRVTRGGKTLKLGGLTFELLLALVENAPSLASYEQIAESVWKGRSVSPETIAQRAKMLREALSDDARSPRYFELIRGQGYRLVAEVERLENQPPKKFASRWLPAAAAAVVASIGLAMLSSFLPGDTRSASVAVLPFADLSPEGDQQYLADGIAEELTNQLAGLAGLDVASRTEAFYYREPSNDLQVIGSALNVSAILEGSVRKSDDEIRITVQLIDVDSGFHLWSENFDRRLEGIFAVQEDIAMSVAGALGITLGVGGVNEFPGAGTDNFEAYEAFLRGDFEKAIQLDPDYAAAWGRRGIRIASTMHENAPEDAPAIIDRAYEHVARAVELDPESAVAHSDFATLIYATMDFKRAEQSFAKSFSLKRNHGNVGHYANMMMRVGRSTYARQLHRERLSMLRIPDMPGLLRINVDIALQDFDVAREKAARLTPSFAPLVQLIIEMNDGTEQSVRVAIDGMPRNSADYQELYGPLLEVLDSPEEAIALLTRLADDPDRMWPFKYHNIALVAAYLGYPEFAFEVFSRELRHTTIRFGALWYPVMSDVRRLPAFKDFATEVNLVKYWRDYGWTDFCRPLGTEDFVCE